MAIWPLAFPSALALSGSSLAWQVEVLVVYANAFAAIFVYAYGFRVEPFDPKAEMLTGLAFVAGIHALALQGGVAGAGHVALFGALVANMGYLVRDREAVPNALLLGAVLVLLIITPYGWTGVVRRGIQLVPSALLSGTYIATRLRAALALSGVLLALALASYIAFVEQRRAARNARAGGSRCRADVRRRRHDRRRLLVHSASQRDRRSLTAPFYTFAPMAPVIVAVDLGGTNVRASIGKDAREGRLGRVHQAPSRARDGLDAVVETVARVVRQAAGKGSLAGVGIAVAGHVDGRVVRWSPNFGERTKRGFKMWRNVPFAELIEQEVGAPVVLANDANAAALGEYYHGSGGGSAHSLFLFTLGTGVGTGCVVGGRMFSGYRGGAVEFGHVVIEQSAEPWLTGSPGPVEAFCGARAFEMRFGCTPAAMSRRAKRGEEHALAAWQDYGTWLGTAVGSAINAFAPQIVAIGGGIAKAAPFFLPACLRQARRVAVPSLWGSTSVRTAERLEDAALVGALALARGALGE